MTTREPDQIIKDAERDLGRLSNGQLVDLLMDNTSWTLEECQAYVAKLRPKIKCPACELVDIEKEGAGVGISRSRYARTNICSSCGRTEAFKGFFWRDRCPTEIIAPHHRDPA